MGTGVVVGVGGGSVDVAVSVLVGSGVRVAMGVAELEQPGTKSSNTRRTEMRYTYHLPERWLLMDLFFPVYK